MVLRVSRPYFFLSAPPELLPTGLTGLPLAKERQTEGGMTLIFIGQWPLFRHEWLHGVFYR